jgi:catalase (peroxidase I)
LQVLLGDAFFGSDNALADNPDTLALVKEYAEDNEAWYKDFEEKFIDLTWKGVDPSVPRLGF